MPVPSEGTVMREELPVGALGWEHPAWVGDFYPDDLPPEWRLTYYANEFPLLLLPGEAWRTADRERLRGWCEDVSERFRFVLDVSGIGPDAGTTLGQLQACRCALGDRLAGAVSWSRLSGQADAVLQGALGDACPLARAATLAGVTPDVRVAEAAAWSGVLIPEGAGHDLRWLRGVFESLAPRFRGVAPPMLFFAGRPPPVRLMREAPVLWQLLNGLRS